MGQMIFKSRYNAGNNGHRVVLMTVLCFFVIGLLSMMAAPRKRHKRVKDSRVYLVHADQLSYDIYGPNPDAQIVKGRVSFRHQGARLTCDSAYFYQTSNSVRAFGHVRFRQGDTLSLTCDRAWYDGGSQMMEARQNVVLRHRRQTLYTDSLNFDRLYNNAYFFRGGRLIDGKTKLSSDWGEYNTETKQAVFYYDVQLRTPDNHVSTDTLYYDSRSRRAHVVGKYTPNHGTGKTGPSVITGKSGKVLTEDAFFYTGNDQAELFGRSTVEDQEKVITGDTLYYNSKSGRHRGVGNVVFVDKRHKNELHCGYVVYNEKTGKGFATRRPLMMDYSQKDTLYLHSDTMRIETFYINTDSVYRKVHCYPKVRAFRVDAQAVCDSLVGNSRDSSMTMYHDPIVWSDGRQLVGEVIKCYSNDSTLREAQVLSQALSIEIMPDSVHYNQISSKNMFAYFIDGKVRKTEAVGNVRSIYYPVDDKDSSLIGLNYLETDTMRMFISPERKLQRMWTPKVNVTLYPMTQIPPGKEKLDVFVWFDYIRPKNKDDVFNWRGKTSGTEIKHIKRHSAPLQQIGRRPKPSGTEGNAGASGADKTVETKASNGSEQKAGTASEAESGKATSKAAD